MTPQRQEDFLATSIGDGLTKHRLKKLIVTQDNATRWNSADSMIEKALKLHVYINNYCSKNSKWSSNSFLMDNCLILDNWHTLIELHEILLLFRETTYLLESCSSNGSYSTTWKVLPTFYHLFTKTKEQKAHYKALASSSESNVKYHHI